jgi:flagellar L-ring protein precursor FlgH
MAGDRQNIKLRGGIAALVVLLLSGCAGMPQKDTANYAPAQPYPEPKVANTGAIYHDSTARPLFEDLRARHVGDILTIVLTEQTDASKKASTTTKKSTSLDTGVPTILGAGVTWKGKNVLNNSIDSSSDFSGSGDSSQSNSLSGTLSVTVMRVLPNGNLVVRGQKQVTLNQGTEFVQLSGIVRPQDISSGNRVPSTLVANARITYSGRGAVADANAMGWLSRFFISKIWPF